MLFLVSFWQQLYDHKNGAKRSVLQRRFAQHHIFKAITLALCFLPITLHGEIEKVTLTWDKGLCIGSCHQQLEKRLRDIPHVRNVRYEGEEARATLYWQPNASFEFLPVRRAMQMIGLSIVDIQVKARGTITHSDSNVFLNSIGDNTRFTLLGPLKTSTTEYITRFNVASYPITSALRQKLLEAEAKRQLVTIEGSLLMPERPPLKLIIGEMQSHQEE